MSENKRKNLSLSEKLKLIKEFENGKTRNAISAEYFVPLSTLCRILKESDKIKQECSEGHGKIKRNRNSEYPNLEQCLVEWLKQCQSKNVPVNGPILKEKAEEFARKLTIGGFCASNGWLDGFKKRNDLIFKKISGESGAVDINACSQWINDLPALLGDYSPNDIFNADETGLFFKCLPDKTFTFKGISCHGGKYSKERVTILLCANMTGTEKLPVFLIGKSRKPRCFAGVITLPVEYKNNSKAWMTAALFSEWLKKIDIQMRLENRKILLFIDNCTAHYSSDELQHIKVVYLPPNSTSKLQPLDQGVIQNFKINYRREVVRHILTNLESNGSLEINVLIAMRFVKKAWLSVTQTTIANCFRKAGFRINGLQEPQYSEWDSSHEELRPSFQEWSELTSNAGERVPSFEDYVNVDENIEVTGEQTVDDIVSTLQMCDTNENDSDEDHGDTLEIKLVKKREALEALHTLTKFFEQRETEPKIFENIIALERNVENVVTDKQTKIFDFFKT